MFFFLLGHLLMQELCRNGAVMYYAKINSEYQTKKFEGEGLNFDSETWLNIFFCELEEPLFSNPFHIQIISRMRHAYINPFSLEEGEAIRSIVVSLRFSVFAISRIKYVLNMKTHSSTIPGNGRLEIDERCSPVKGRPEI